jgi:hypothetical protein
MTAQHKDVPVPLGLASIKPGDLFCTAPGKLVEALEVSRIALDLENVNTTFGLLKKIMYNLSSVRNNAEALEN